MKSFSPHPTKHDRNAHAPVPQPTKRPATQEPHPLPVSPCDDLHILITKRAYALHTERGYRQGYALDDWLDAEREILSQIPPV